ncbi:hypothetical protein F4813DRAFT_366426 [Daldinia decipiens]|uniref:uncharacterized protein n=1 Tax=Daldinia decipiens TaxID=326647 RepID=UPI0020C1D526|nr:uncharacterized protein F4813DRAFT_366426 [Daldinia decipiens]KAI1655807.1 hypothetical protein F4813DRAFT_366426 [Daldinia decipiens]
MTSVDAARLSLCNLVYRLLLILGRRGACMPHSGLARCSRCGRIAYRVCDTMYFDPGVIGFLGHANHRTGTSPCYLFRLFVSITSCVDRRGSCCIPRHWTCL